MGFRPFDPLEHRHEPEWRPSKEFHAISRRLCALLEWLDRTIPSLHKLAPGSGAATRRKNPFRAIEELHNRAIILGKVDTSSKSEVETERERIELPCFSDPAEALRRTSPPTAPSPFTVCAPNSFANAPSQRRAEHSTPRMFWATAPQLLLQTEVDHGGLLRLKRNTLIPASQKCSAPFFNPESYEHFVSGLSERLRIVERVWRTALRFAPLNQVLVCKLEGFL